MAPIDAPTFVLASDKSKFIDAFGDMMIYFPLYFTGFAIFVFALQAVASIFKAKKKSNFE